MPGISGPEALKFAQKFWGFMVKSKGFERSLEKIVITGAGNGSCTAEFKVEEGLTNHLLYMHGGCIFTVIDCISTIGLLTATEKRPGVSVNLSVNYLAPAPLGTMIQIESRTVKIGKSLAYLDAVLKNKENGILLASGTHVKYIAE